MQVKRCAPENKLVGKAGIVGVCSVGFHHALLFALEALMDPCQAVWAVECVFGVLQVLVQVQRHAQRVAVELLHLCGRVTSCWCITLLVAVRFVI